MNKYDETREYLHKVNSGLWEIISPHVLYLSPNQGETYSSMKENEDYNRFHDETIQIIEGKKKEILAHLDTNHLTLIDLGPEYPDKTLPLMKEMHSTGHPIDYLPVDINENYLKIAADAARPYVNRIFTLNCRFEDVAQRIQLEMVGKKFAFIGLTFMNYNPEKIIRMMKDIVGDDGAIGIATELITPQNTIDTIKHHYQNEQTRQFILEPVKNLNINLDKTEIDIRFENGRVEAGFIIKEDLPDLGIQSNDRIIVAISHRYHINDLKDILNKCSPESYIWTSESNKTAFVLCKFSPA